MNRRMSLACVVLEMEPCATIASKACNIVEIDR